MMDWTTAKQQPIGWSAFGNGDLLFVRLVSGPVHSFGFGIDGRTRGFLW